MLSFTSGKDFDDLKDELKDRFGEIPKLAESTILYYKLKMLADKTDLLSFKINVPNIILEFDEKRLPSREKLSILIKQYNYPVSFSTTRNFLITFNISNEKISVIQKGIKILEFIIENF